MKPLSALTSSPEILLDQASLIPGIPQGPSLEFVFTSQAPGHTVQESLDSLETAYPGTLTLNQVHGSAVVPALQAQHGKSADGWVLKESSRHWVAIQVADCLPVLMFHPEHGAAAALHCGHRGLSGGIILVAAKLLSDSSKEREGSIMGQAWLGPCIGPCCYQVQWDVAQNFQEWPEALQPHPERGYWLNLQVVALSQLHAAGYLLQGQVKTCTHCHSDRLASYRRDGRAASRQFLLCRLVEP